jgi:hypothetical protein
MIIYTLPSDRVKPIHPFFLSQTEEKRIGFTLPLAKDV